MLFFHATPISLFFILLTSLIFPLCLLIVWNKFFTIKNFLFFNLNLFLLELFLIFVFLSIDLFLFYIFFEATLIPMLYFLGYWGSRSRKIKAMYYFFYYTFFGSFCMLIAICN
jgi:NADH:ubiquinone oxidoreductase subunit 4 (subunit M)